jgi:hypothetical protein
MKKTLKLMSVAALLLVFATGSVFAANTVMITSDISNENAELSVTQLGKSGTKINLDIPAIGLTSTSLNNTTYDYVALPVADKLIAGETAEDGMPDIPVLSTWIAVPDMAGIKFTVSYTNVEIINDIDLAPTQSPLPESSMDIPPFVLDSETYATDAFYPAEIAEVKDPIILRDLRLAQVVMYPVRYNPVKRQLKVYSGLEVEVEYTSDNPVNPKKNSR